MRQSDALRPAVKAERGVKRLVMAQRHYRRGDVGEAPEALAKRGTGRYTSEADVDAGGRRMHEVRRWPPWHDNLAQVNRRDLPGGEQFHRLGDFDRDAQRPGEVV